MRALWAGDICVGELAQIFMRMRCPQPCGSTECSVPTAPSILEGSHAWHIPQYQGIARSVLCALCSVQGVQPC